MLRKEEYKMKADHEKGTSFEIEQNYYRRSLPSSEKAVIFRNMRKNTQTVRPGNDPSENWETSGIQL